MLSIIVEEAHVIEHLSIMILFAAYKGNGPHMNLKRASAAFLKQALICMNHASRRKEV